LKAQASSGWRQQQLLTCCFVNVFDFGTSNTSVKIGYRNVRLFLVILYLPLNRDKGLSFSIYEAKLRSLPALFKLFRLLF
jgi:hypothetical protein